MEQEMWCTNLQSAEETLCAGWLLFSAKEYDQEVLCQEIWSLTGVNIALQFWAIDDGTKKDTKNKYY